MTVDHRPLLARKAPQIRRVLIFGLVGCALLGAVTGAGIAVHLTTTPHQEEA